MTPGELVSLVISLAVPAVALAVIPLVLVGGTAVLLTQQRLVGFGLVAILTMFPDPSDYGLVSANPFALIYAYGRNTLFFSLFDYALFAAWLVCAVFGPRWRKADASSLAAESWRPLPLNPIYLAIAVLLAVHVAAGLADPLHSTRQDLDFRGFINLVRAGMVAAVIYATLRTPRDLDDLAKLMVACLLMRELFGLFRYLFLGGDPQNAYALLQDLPIKITFWDINDSILAGALVAYSLWRALTERLTPRQRMLWLAAALLGMLTALLSARRTGQGGLLLAVVGMLLMLPRGRRWPIVLVMCAAVPLALWKTQARAVQGQGVLASFILDIKTSPYEDSRLSRFHELRMAWPTMRENLLFGVGPSGGFSITNTRGLEYHHGRFDFVHSGFGHVLLKAGLIGLALFLALFVTYAWHFLRWWKLLPDDRRPLAIASLGGMLTMVPNVLVGTPVIEMRTSMVMALMLVIPFLLTRDLTRPTRTAQSDAARRAAAGNGLHRPLSPRR